MKPVFQTMFDKNGNCLSACIASMLELDLLQVPSWDVIHANQIDSARRWLADTYNICLLSINPIAYHFMIGNPNIPCIASVKSQQYEGAYHAVCGIYDGKSHTFELTHDPNPNNDINRPQDLQRLYFLIGQNVLPLHYKFQLTPTKIGD